LFLEPVVKWLLRFDYAQATIVEITESLVEGARGEEGPGRWIDEL
jgi:hypothetical protein